MTGGKRIERQSEISARAAGGAALVNNLALVKGTPNYTLSVKSAQGVGTYRLAEGVSSFKGSITVKSGSTTLGSVTTAKALTKNGRKYALSVSGGRLNVAVTAVEGSAEELLQSSLAESCAMNLSSSCAVEGLAGGLNLGMTSEESFSAASLFDFDSSTKTTGALLAG